MKRWLLPLLILLGLVGVWLTATEDTRVWPVRNTAQYQLYRVLGWTDLGVGEGTGTLRGRIQGPDGRPVAGAQVLVPRRDGATWSARSGTDGHFRIEGLPAGRYHPVAGAAGFADRRVESRWGGVTVLEARETELVVTLEPEVAPVVPLVRDATFGQLRELTCEEPLARRATRRTLGFTASGGQPNAATFLYAPVTATAALPTLLAVYPGPAAEWECVSVPLAAAGYAVLAVGPAYSLELERDVDELQQVVALVRAGQVPGANGTRVAVLGGSYSTLLLQRLLQRDPTVEAAVLLGPPTDLFAMRRLFEEGTFVPPFGLDKVLVALGFPDQEPLRYFRYSGAYHVRPDFPPTLLIHSRNDEIVPAEQSERLAVAMAAEGVEHDLYLFDAATHYLLSGDSDALEIYRLTLDFLAHHLTSDE